MSSHKRKLTGLLKTAMLEYGMEKVYGKD